MDNNIEEEKINKKVFGQYLLSMDFHIWLEYMFPIMWRHKYIYTKGNDIINKTYSRIYKRELTRININAPARIGKCFQKGTLIRMFDGSTKKVEDIKENDLIMGDDNTSRIATGITRGYEEMFKITLKDGRNFVCNGSHILVLKDVSSQKKNRKSCSFGKERLISVFDYIKSSKNFKKHNHIVFKEVEYISKKVNIEPYLLGIWLADGRKSGSGITNMDEEVINYLQDWCVRNKHNFNIKKSKSKAFEINLTTGIVKKKDKVKPLLSYLREYNLLNNKHIPNDYLINDKKTRLELLAGILDGDGFYNKSKNSICITLERKILVDNLKELCYSLGFYCSQSLKYNKKYNKNYYFLYISGNIEQIPMLLNRKKNTGNRICRYDFSSQSFKVESLGMGEYYGFCLNNNHKFMLGNYIVSHNTDNMIDFITYCVLKSNCNFIYTSSSKAILGEVRKKLENIFLSEEFRDYYPTTYKEDEELVKFTDPIFEEEYENSSGEDNLKYTFSSRKITLGGSQILLIPRGSIIAGLAAGRVTDKDEFTGAICLDDIDKIEETRKSRLIRNKLHDWYSAEVLSRLEDVRVPVINIQHRVAQEDMSGYLKKTYNFYECKVPLVDENGEVLFLKSKYNVEELKKDNYRWQSLYQQEPISDGGNLFKLDWFNNYEIIPQMKYTIISCDTALKTGNRNDYSVLMLLGVSMRNDIYILDMVRGKWESPELLLQLRNFYHKYCSKQKLGITRPICVYIEDKASGTELIRAIKTYRIPIKAVTPKKDKIQRAQDILPLIHSGYVYIPAVAEWRNDFIEEITGFPHYSHDDICDSFTQGLANINSYNLFTDIL